MSIALSRSEVAELTGLTQAAAQIRWLKRRGWKHEVDQSGRPVVDKRYYDSRMGNAAEPSSTNEPNFAALYA